MPNEFADCLEHHCRTMQHMADGWFCCVACRKVFMVRKKLNANGYLIVAGLVPEWESSRWPEGAEL